LFDFIKYQFVVVESKSKTSHANAKAKAKEKLLCKLDGLPQKRRQ
jgi:hypothetical protein